MPTIENDLVPAMLYGMFLIIATLAIIIGYFKDKS